MPRNPQRRADRLEDAHIVTLTWSHRASFNECPKAARRRLEGRIFQRWRLELDRITAQARQLQRAAAPQREFHLQVVMAISAVTPRRSVAFDWSRNALHDVARYNVTWTTDIMMQPCADASTFEHFPFRRGGPNQTPESAFKASCLAEQGPQQFVVHPFMIDWQPRVHPAAWPRHRPTLAMGVWGVARVFKRNHDFAAGQFYLDHGPAATWAKFCSLNQLHSALIIPCLRLKLMLQLRAAGREGAGKPVTMLEIFSPDYHDRSKARPLFDSELAVATTLNSTFCVVPTGDNWTRKALCRCIAHRTIAPSHQCAHGRTGATNHS